MQFQFVFLFIFQAIRVPLMECVERTQAVAKAMAEKQFELAVELRGRSFARNLETYKMLTRLKPPKETQDGKPAVRENDHCPWFKVVENPSPFATRRIWH